MKKTILAIGLLVLIAFIFFLRDVINNYEKDRSQEISVLEMLKNTWDEFEKTIPEKPILGSTKWGTPGFAQFLSADRLLVSYDDGHIARVSLIEKTMDGFKHLQTFFDEKFPYAEIVKSNSKIKLADLWQKTYSFDFNNSVWQYLGTNPFYTKRYRNNEYSFVLSYPADWKIFEGKLPSGEPVINIYHPDTKEEPPFIHFDNVTNVSIFPNGVPTEGITGEARASQVAPTSAVKDAIEFILKDNTVWARMAYFRRTPKSWQGGFLWSRVETRDLKEKCMLGDEELPLSDCAEIPPKNSNAKLIREGALVNPKEAEQIDAIFKSFVITE